MSVDVSRIPRCLWHGAGIGRARLIGSPSAPSAARCAQSRRARPGETDPHETRTTCAKTSATPTRSRRTRLANRPTAPFKRKPCKGQHLDTTLSLSVRKDRHVMLPAEVLNLLRQWWKARPTARFQTFVEGP
jgi:hypothetical protein